MALPQLEVSDKELSKRLLKDASNAPLTLASGVSTVLLGVSSVLFMSSEWLVVLAGLTGLSMVTLTAYLLKKTVFGRHAAMLKIIEKVRNETIQEREKMMALVKDKLADLYHSVGLAQLSQLETKFSAFSQVLDMQFDRDELTHKRYLTVAEQLYFGAIDNLRTVTTLQLGMQAIDVESIQQNLRKSDLDPARQDALQQRLNIYQQSAQREQSILASNEQVMTKLDEVTSRLSAIQSREGLSSLKLDSAMREIRHLIERVDDYDIQQ
jgi:hypothetical protein